MKISNPRRTPRRSYRKLLYGRNQDEWLAMNIFILWEWLKINRPRRLASNGCLFFSFGPTVICSMVRSLWQQVRHFVVPDVTSRQILL